MQIHRGLPVRDLPRVELMTSRRIAVRRSSSSHVVAALLAIASAAFSSVATAAPTFDFVDLSSHSSLTLFSMTNSFAGAGTTHDGRVVFAPYLSNHVGVFDPKLMGGSVEDAFKLYDTNLVMKNKFYSAITVGDGRVVFPPFNAGGVGVFDGRNNTFSMHGQQFTYSGFAYNGGGVASDGKVVMCPYQDSYLTTLDLETYEVVKATTPTPGWVSPTGWHGGSVTLDGRVVCAPFNANSVFVYSSGSITNIAVSVNKFVGATTIFDGRIFMAPWEASAVGIFDPSTNGFTTDSTILPTGEDKYLSGVVTAPDGRVVFQEHAGSGNTRLFDPNDDSLISLNTDFSTAMARNWWGAAVVRNLVVFAPRFVTAVGYLKFPTCGEDEHVVSGVCVLCPPGQSNEEGDAPYGPDTACYSECSCAHQKKIRGFTSV